MKGHRKDNKHSTPCSIEIPHTPLKYDTTLLWGIRKMTLTGREGRVRLLKVRWDPGGIRIFAGGQKAFRKTEDVRLSG